MSAPKEHGIIMSGPSILAYRAGRKTQTRRLSERWLKVKQGDRLWFRETHAFIWPDLEPAPQEKCLIEYRADSGDKYPGGFPDDCGDDADCGRWKPSIYMRRFAARYTPLVTADARLEQWWNISEEDVAAEGASCIATYADLWDDLHPKPGELSEDNPMVVVLEFERVKA